MSNRRKPFATGWRGVVMIVVGVFIGATLITPAVAHVTSSLTHLWTHTDKRYYKKTTANSRFINVGETAGGDLSGTYPNPTLAPRESVQTPTLLTCDGTNNWTSPQAFAIPLGFWKDRSGVVHLQGSVGCSGDATEGGGIFILPAGYRPASGPGVVRWAALAGSQTIAQIAVLDAGPGAGAVVYDGPNNAAADDYISLDGLTFRAES